MAQPWLILSMTQSSFLVGLDSFAMNAPGWLFTLVGGQLADRKNRKRVIVICQSIQFLCVLAMLVLLVLHVLKVWMIIGFSFLIGTTDSLSMPSYQSIIPSLVTKREIPRAVTLNSTQYNLSRILGPAIAGFVMAHYGAPACFSINAFSYIPFFVALYWITPKTRLLKESIVLDAPAQTVDYKMLLRSDLIRAPLATIFVTSLLCGPLTTFCPVIITDIFHADVSRFGGAIAALGVGGLLGAALSFFLFRLKWSRSRLATFVGILLGSVICLIALSRSLVLLTPLMVAAGTCMTLSSISAGAYLQEISTNAFRGKTVSLSQFAMQVGISTGGLLTGYLTTHLGISVVLLGNGIAAVILQSLIFAMGQHGYQRGSATLTK